MEIANHMYAERGRGSIVKVYEVKGPCPDLGLTLAKLAAELREGEEAVIVSKWRYILNDLANSAGLLGIEVVSYKMGDVVEVLVRRSRPNRRP